MPFVCRCLVESYFLFISFLFLAVFLHNERKNGELAHERTKNSTTSTLNIFSDPQQNGNCDDDDAAADDDDDTVENKREKQIVKLNHILWLENK